MDRARKLRTTAIHCLRVVLVAALLLLIPSPRRDQTLSDTAVAAPQLDSVRSIVSAAATIDSEQDSSGLWAVRDPEGNAVARVARTLPESADVIGYRGPSEAMIVFNEDLNVIGVQMIASDDTEEHVRAVEDDTRFFEQFRGWSWNGPDSDTKIDAVSGATLTSLALAKGVLKRLGGERPSLVFPDEITAEELRDWFAELSTTRMENDLVEVLAQDNQPIGTAFRTGPLSDDVVGYQGPTELLIKLNPDGSTIDDIKLRSSFDNQPYVRYCKTEYGFWALFKGKTIDELSGMDLEAAGVEGVSGATMTSLAIAETLVAASQRLQQKAQANAEAERESAATLMQRVTSGIAEIDPSASDWACVSLLFLIPLFRTRGWFRKKRIRILWLLSVIVVIGFWSGNLISMALIAGWSGGGIAWQIAPALAALVFVAFLGPPAAKANPYCNHLCPHGAIQQLARPTKKNRRHRNPPRKLLSVLKFLPGTTLAVAYVTLLMIPTTDLSSWNPFTLTWFASLLGPPFYLRRSRSHSRRSCRWDTVASVVRPGVCSTTCDAAPAATDWFWPTRWR